MSDVKSWIGRSVVITEGPSAKERGIVLAVDDIATRPSAWVKVRPDSEYPAYRSCDLCWLEDETTGEGGPALSTQKDPT